MSPLKPLGRRPRSPGQRSFGGAHPMGSPAEWHKVVHSPEVQRMLQDPQLASALYQNFRATGGQLPTGIDGSSGTLSPAGMPSPVGMQQGGGVPTPEELNQLAQMRGGDVDPATGEQLRMLAQQSRPQRPQRFDQGGENMTDIQKEEQQLDADEQAARKKGDLKTLNEVIPQKRQKLQERKDAIQQQTQQAPGPVSLGNTQVSGQTMSGLQHLGQQGPPTLGNMAMATGIGALMGGGGTGSAAGALIGAGTAGLLNYFIRKNSQQKKQQQDGGWSGGGGGGGGGNQPEPTGQPSPGGGAAGVTGGLADTSTAPPPKDAKGLRWGTSSAGNVRSYDQGKTWLKGNNQPFSETKSDPVINQTQVTTDVAPQSSGSQSSSGLVGAPTENLPGLKMEENTSPGLGGIRYSESDLTGTPNPDQIPDPLGPYNPMNFGLARGGPVPQSSGLGMHHMPIPVLHTTIVIAAKPKRGKGQSEEKPVEKKAMGGEIPQEARRARKPRAIPPVAGPESSGARLPRGRVQVPRGSGAAIKGKRFGGVF